MKIRDSGIPEISVWEKFFDVNNILNELKINIELKKNVELGFGYGTFNIPVSRRINGKIYTYDIEEQLVNDIESKLKLNKIENVVPFKKDFILEGTGLKNGDIVYLISEKDLIPEGIAYSSKTNCFYLSSIYKTKIIKINAGNGIFNDFIPSNLLDIQFLGMITDDARNLLWACGNNTINGKRKSIVAKFNLETGELLKTYSHRDTLNKTNNDLVYDDKGNIYYTDSNGKCIYVIDEASDSVSVFFEGDDIIYPNGITISPDNKYLYIASNDHGIRIIDISKRAVINKTNSSIDSKGLDGLKFYKNSIIGIQNEVKSRSDVKIARYLLNENGTDISSMQIIDQNNPNFDIPTTFVLVNDLLYCLANSQLGNLSSEGEIRSVQALDDIIILKYDLISR